MKKQYINPEINVIKLASNRSVLTVTSPTLPTGTTPTDPASGDAPMLDWDDDWEDE